MSGKNLGHFHILEPLGEGGMGVVYKARDTRLDRLVAIKVLRSESVADEHRRRRFAQEARAASALNHPHIVTIHDIDSDDGTTYIVMEYVHGHTLAQHIRSQKRNLNETLRYAAQIADALAAAHAAGIVHRDLKPGNVMIAASGNRSGSVKVLDFGLAKLVEPSPQVEATITVARHDQPKTAEGTIVGTAAYMSPEQAEGKPADHRSDIFSFGSIFYEMLTGRRPFQGETPISTLSSILRDDPKPLSDVVPDAPRELERIVGRCLRKDPGKRFQHADDLRIALEELRDDSESGRLKPVENRSATVRKRWPLYTAAALFVLALAGAAWWTDRARAVPVGAPGPVLKQLTFDPGLTTDPSYWPQGQLVAYASDRTGGNLDLWVQHLGTGEARRLTSNDADDREPSFSPDGSRIVFRSEREGGGIWTVSTIGGQERKIADRGFSPRYSPDGQWIAYWVGAPGEGRWAGPTEMYVIPSGGGVPRRLAADFLGARNPVWSVDSKHILFLGGRAGPPVATDWWITPLEAGTSVQTNAWKALRGQKIRSWAPSAWEGNYVYFSGALGDSTNLWRFPVDPGTLQISGAAERLTSGSGLELHGTISGAQLLFVSLTQDIDIWALPIDSNQGKPLGEPSRITEDLAPNLNCSTSSDGRRLVFATARMEKVDVVVRDIVTGQETIIAGAPEMAPYPRISSDGSWVAYTSGRETLSSFALPTRGGVPRKLCDDCQLRTWAYDGKRLVVTSRETRDTYFLDLNTGARTPMLPAWEGFPAAPKLSADDRWVAFYSLAPEGRTRIWIAPVLSQRAAEQREWIQVSDGSAWEVVPEFSPNGKLLYFLSQRDGFRCQWAQRLDPATKKPVGAPFAIYHHHRTRLSPAYAQYGTVCNSVARDKITFTMGERKGNIWLAAIQD